MALVDSEWRRQSEQSAILVRSLLTASRHSPPLTMPLPNLPPLHSVVVAKQEFKFNLAHFVAFPGFRERLHGHNYHMSVTLRSSSISKNDGYVLDFGDVKTVVRGVCKRMNERVVIPVKSNVLSIKTMGFGGDGAGDGGGTADGEVRRAPRRE